MHTTTVVVYDSNPASILLRACDAALPLRGGLPCGELLRNCLDLDGQMRGF